MLEPLAPRKACVVMRSGLFIGRFRFTLQPAGDQWPPVKLQYSLIFVLSARVQDGLPAGDRHRVVPSKGEPACRFRPGFIRHPSPAQVQKDLVTPTPTMRPWPTLTVGTP